ncbi:hypothetical protein ACI65C_006275 [Semiaphis heraclei]
MLPKDLTYYKLIKMPDNRDYIVGSYSYILPSAQHSDILADLYFRDFDTLSEENWLCNFVIDICLMSYAYKLGLRNTHILSVNHARQLMEKREIGEPLIKTTFTQDSTVILPLLVNINHWIVVVINFKTKMCYIMDPFNPYDTESRSSKLHFKHVSEMLKLNVVYELLGALEEAENRAIVNRPRQYYNAQNVMEGLCNSNK